MRYSLAAVVLLLHTANVPAQSISNENRLKLIEHYVTAAYCLGFEAVMQEAPEDKARSNREGHLADLATAERAGNIDEKRRAELYASGRSDANACLDAQIRADRKSTRLNSSH